MQGRSRGIVAPWCFHPLNWERCFLPLFCKRYLDRWFEHTLRSFCQIGDKAYWSYEVFLMNAYFSVSTESSKAFYSVWSLIISRVTEQSLSCGQLIKIVGETTSRLTCPFILQAHAGQGVVGRLKRLKDVLSSVFLAGWVMITCKIWLGVLGVQLLGSD